MNNTLKKSGIGLETNSAYYCYTFPKQILEDAEAIIHSSPTMTFINSHQALVFQKLSEQVVDDFYFTTSPSRLLRDPSYNRIIDMGRYAIPLLIEQLDSNPTHWFPALCAISQINPIKKGNEGVIANMVEDWKNWAKENVDSNK